MIVFRSGLPRRANGNRRGFTSCDRPSGAPACRAPGSAERQLKEQQQRERHGLGREDVPGPRPEEIQQRTRLRLLPQVQVVRAEERVEHGDERGVGVQPQEDAPPRAGARPEQAAPDQVQDRGDDAAVRDEELQRRVRRERGADVGGEERHPGAGEAEEVGDLERPLPSRDERDDRDPQHDVAEVERQPVRRPHLAVGDRVRVPGELDGRDPHREREPQRGRRRGASTGDRREPGRGERDRGEDRQVNRAEGRERHRGAMIAPPWPVRRGAAMSTAWNRVSPSAAAPAYFAIPTGIRGRWPGTRVPDRDGTRAGAVSPRPYSVPGKAPPSSSRFWPVMKPACALHR